MAWTEIGLDDAGYREYAVKLAKDFETWDEIDKIILQDVCASFATSSATMIFAIIPLLGMLLVTPFPDWGYEEDYLRDRIKNWKSKARWMHFINPLRIIGYPLALLFVWRLRKKLRKAYDETKNT